MQTLKFSVSLSDQTHPAMRVSADDADGDVVIALPLRPRREPATAAIVVGTGAQGAANSAEDDYLLGGYAGI